MAGAAFRPSAYFPVIAPIKLYEDDVVRAMGHVVDRAKQEIQQESVLLSQVLKALTPSICTGPRAPSFCAGRTPERAAADARQQGVSYFRRNEGGQEAPRFEVYRM